MKTWPVNIFDHVRCTSPSRTERWSARQVVVEFGRARTVDSKDAAPLVSFCDYCSPAAGRSTSNIQLVHAIVGDIDGAYSKDAFLAGAQTLRGAGVFAVIHQTFSSTPTQPRWRVIAFLDEPIRPQDYRSCWMGLNAIFGDTFDPAAKDAARISYMPSSPQGRACIARAINEGLWTQ